MKKCAKCSPKSYNGFALCPDCFAKWPKGFTLEEYASAPHNAKPRRMPDHIALVNRQKFEPALLPAPKFLDDPERSA